MCVFCLKMQLAILMGSMNQFHYPAQRAGFPDDGLLNVWCLVELMVGLVPRSHSHELPA